MTKSAPEDSENGPPSASGAAQDPARTGKHVYEIADAARSVRGALGRSRVNTDKVKSPQTNLFPGSDGRDNIGVPTGATDHADSNAVQNYSHGTGRSGRTRKGKRRVDRFAYVVLLRTYTTALTRGNVLGPDSLAVRVRTLQLAFQVLLDARRRIDTLDPRKIGAKEIGVLAQWMAEKSVGYQAKLWTAVEAFLLFCKNTILPDLEAQKLWKRPRPTYTAKGVKDEAWLQDSLRRLDGIDGWRTTVTRFVVAFIFGTGLRPKELRLADLKDLDTIRWTFKVMHPKKVRGAVVGAELDVYEDTKVHVMDFLAARDKHLRAEGRDPATVVALIPSERGMHYSEVGFRNVRLDTYRKAGIEGDFRVLRRTHEQILMDRLEAQGRKDVSVIEIAAKRLRHTPQVALGHYVEYRSGRAKDVAKAAWESPRIEVR